MSKLGKHRSCLRCRAYEPKCGGIYSSILWRCSLGFNEDNGKPNQPCPHPRTINELIAAMPKAAPK